MHLKTARLSDQPQRDRRACSRKLEDDQKHRFKLILSLTVGGEEYSADIHTDICVYEGKYSIQLRARPARLSELKP